MPSCQTCEVEMTPRMYARHILKKHELDLCEACGSPVTTFAWTSPRTLDPEFCSRTCRDTKIGNRCHHCRRHSGAGFLEGLCRECSAFQHTLRGYDHVDSQLHSFERARRLPAIYRREGRRLDRAS